MGPALQEEGGSLCIWSARIPSQERSVAAPSPCSITPLSQTVVRANGEAAAAGGRHGVHVPTEVSEFLVDALESHGDVFCVVWRGALCGKRCSGVAQRVWLGCEEVMKPVNVSGVAQRKQVRRLSAEGPPKAAATSRRHTGELQ